MIRRGYTGSDSSGFRNLSEEGQKQTTKLEEKKKRVNESYKSPEVKRVNDFNQADLRKLNETRTQLKDEDEIPTGFLDEDEEDELYSEPVKVSQGVAVSRKIDEEDVPTGFFDEDEDDSPSEIKVTRVDSESAPRIKESPQKRVNAQSSQRQASGQRQMDSSRQFRPRQNHPNQERLESIHSRSGGDFVATEPPIRKEDLEQLKEKEKAMKPKKKEEPQGRKKGAGLIIGLVVLMVLVVTAFVAVLVSRLNGTSSKVDTGMSLETITGMVDSLYTDQTKVDILDTVVDADIQDCIDGLELYKSDKIYNEEDYDKLSKEIGTISFFLQDKSMYNDLSNGTYEVGSEAYLNTINTIKSDIYLYTVAGLADTMTTKVQILETTSQVTPSETESTTGAGSDTVITDMSGTGDTEAKTDTEAESEQETGGSVNLSDVLNSISSGEE